MRVTIPGVRFLTAEALLLFGGVPALFLTGLPRRITAPILLAAVTYAAIQGLRARLVPRRSFGMNGFRRGRPHLWLFVAFAAVSTAAVAVFEPDQLFVVVRNDPRLWVLMLVIYCVFSVYPQTLLYRMFFLERYRGLFRSESTLILANAVAFSWAHNLIPHPLVYVLTFGGGLLFSRTWLRSRSALAVSIEHALYGFWLFTVGLGSYFAFPGA
ncbi:MAG: CPBP family glutamic-type intramembrane protease [Alkalispirochaeta sp.]